MLFALLFTAPWKATASTVHNMGTITIYVDEQKTFYRGYIPNSYYVNANSWFLRQVTGSSWIDSQEFYDAKIVSSNSESCTIMGLCSNDDEYNFSTTELHCKGTRQSQGDYEEMVWTIVVKSYGLLEVEASPAGGSITSGSKVTLTAICNGSTVSGSDIYYTLDGSVPTKNRSKYTSAGIIINNSCRLKAKAYKTGYDCIYIGDWYYTVKTLVTGITLNATSVSLSTSGANSTKQLTATVSPSNATDKSVTWSSSNTSVATVSSSGLVTAKSAGTATITCKANDGSGKSASCKVMVESTPTNPDIYITSIQSGNADLTSLTQNDKLSLTATFMNYGATATVSTRLWILDEDMLTVAYSNTQTSTFYGNSLTTVSMDYALTDIPAGRYFASILYYDEWEMNTWLYTPKYLVEIDIVDSSPINKGDVNEDGKVNGTDLVALTNIILGKNAQKASADVNGDGKVNGTDYVALANIILGKTAASRSLDTDMDVSGTATLHVEPISICAGETRELTVSLTNPDDELTLLQFDLLLPDGLYINKVDDNPSVSMGSRTSGNSHQLSAYADGQRFRCLLASPGNELISGTEGAVVRLTVTAADNFCGGSLLLADAIGVSPCEQEVKMPLQRYGLTETATGVAGVKNAEESSEVYSLTGQRQVKMKRGINVVNGKKIIKK